MSEAHPEIVIIRRNHGGDHDEHHGGVWKIAFADFMTAMMAFFLVMWLISANDKTRASVARYFNPVRLVDATTQPRGLHDTKKDESGITASPDNKKADDKKEKPGTAGPDKSAPASETTKAPESASAKDKRLDKALRDEPFVALAEIASGKPPHATKPAASALSNNGPGRGGEAYRDPFAPPPASASADRTETDALGSTDAALLPAPEDDHRSGSATDKANADRSEPGKPAAQSAALKAAEGKASTSDPMSPVDKTGTAAAAPIAKTKAATETAEKLTKLAANLQKEANATGPAMTISQTPEGVLLSLTDRGNFSMFSNGSAVPSKQLVLLMGDVGKLLKNRPGAIVVRGYTDNKQFRSRRYDNWNLSLDRAQVAHYMLMRGGLPDARFDHVEGYADHAGKADLDPGDPLNRRIDILIKDAS